MYVRFGACLFGAASFVFCAAPSDAERRASRLIFSASQARGIAKPEAGTADAKLSHVLRAALAAEVTDGEKRADALHLLGPRVRDGDYWQVYVRTRHGRAHDVAGRIERRGGEVDLVVAPLIQAWIEDGELAELAREPDVLAITMPGVAVSAAAASVSEGDAVHGADVFRSEYGSDGTGVTVAVIADGVDSLAQAYASGDLPEPNEIRVLSPGAGDEGTAMLEIVHDLAPGADLAFLGPQTSLEMASGIFTLAGEEAVEVIVDDLIFLDEPVFEDGPIANAVAQVVAFDVSYHSSAGNQGVSHYERDFVGKATDLPDLGTVVVHEFAAGDNDIDLQIGAGGTVFLVLQWNEPFGAATSDYDLHIFDPALETRIASSADVQTGSEDPIEEIGIMNGGSTPAQVKVVVQRSTGSDRTVVLHAYLDGRFLEHGSADGSVFGHASVPGAIAVTAVNNADPGHDTVPAYASRGPTRIDFPETELREKPDLAALDGVQVSGAGGFPSPFFGTSASVAHSAAAAALLLSHGAPGGAAVFDCLKAGAADRGAPGHDATFGAGLLDIPAAAELCFPTAVCGDADASGSTSATDALTALRTAVGAAACPACVCDVNADGSVTATDGLLLLQFGVGQPVALNCPACP